jgi:hypothetical protein
MSTDGCCRVATGVAGGVVAEPQLVKPRSKTISKERTDLIGDLLCT